jgi:hypothetical protein
MNNKIRATSLDCSLLAIAAVVLSLILPAQSVFARAWLKVCFEGYSGSECKTQMHDAQLAGSQSDIVLNVRDESFNPSYRGLPSGPPAGLILTVGLRSSRSDSFVPSPILLQRIHPEFYITNQQVRNDSDFQAGYEIGENNMRPSYHFLITIPSDIAGNDLCISAALDDPVFGHLEASCCNPIVAPCTAEDGNQVLGTYVCFAYKSGNPARAVALTDSLMATGWHWWTALIWAQISAQHIGRYDRALAYLDLLYTTYGRVTPDGPLDSTREAREYQITRTYLARMVDQQQQH